MSKQPSTLMPQVTFSILLALSLKPRHGYEIMQQVELDSGGRIKLGPGALYGTVKQLVESGLIEEDFGFDTSERRRYYKLTNKGWDCLGAEIDYFDKTVKVAQKRQAVRNQLGIADS